MGFLAPTAFAKQRQPIPLLPACGECGLDKKCRSPKMRVSGEGRLKTLIVGEAPGWNEDEQGKPFVGNAGGELLTMLYELGVNLRRDCWITNALICRPHQLVGGKDENRPPKPEEVDHCRPNLVSTINQLRPERIILLGKHAVRSLMYWIWKEDSGEYSHEGEMARWAGWLIPSIKLNAWVCPTYHPSFVLQNQKRCGATRMIVKDHLRAAFALKGRPYTTVPDYGKQVRVELDPVRAANAITDMAIRSRLVAFDYETTCLKPDGSNARILCCSVSDGDTSIAFPWQGKAVRAVQRILKSMNVGKITAGHFEERWTWKEFGHGIWNWKFNTLPGAHWDRVQGGTTSVKFQAFVRFGVPYYAGHLERLMDGGKDSNAPNRLAEADITDLCRYCAFDSLYEWMIADQIMKEMR